MSSYPPPPPPDDNRRREPDYPIYPPSGGYPQPPTQPGGEQPPGWGGGQAPSGQAPYGQSGARRRGGFWGGLAAVLAAIVGYGKYVLLLAVKVPFLATLVSMGISLALWAALYGIWFAVGLIAMIFIHEMGHVLEIRRQGMKATAPVFIPFFGAAIFQRQHATDALHQAEIGIAGPIAGTVAATVAFVLYATLHQPILLLWAYVGFLINLFNMIPVGMLDGGWVMAVVSKWFQVLGIVALVVAALFFGFSPLVFIIAIFSVPAIIARFRNDSLAYYQAVPVSARWAMGILWLALVAYLGFAAYESHQLLTTVIGR
jgi:Zn-dependent protease